MQKSHIGASKYYISLIYLVSKSSKWLLHKSVLLCQTPSPYLHFCFLFHWTNWTQFLCVHPTLSQSRASMSMCCAFSTVLVENLSVLLVKVDLATCALKSIPYFTLNDITPATFFFLTCFIRLFPFNWIILSVKWAWVYLILKSLQKEKKKDSSTYLSLQLLFNFPLPFMATFLKNKSFTYFLLNFLNFYNCSPRVNSSCSYVCLCS